MGLIVTERDIPVEAISNLGKQSERLSPKPKRLNGRRRSQKLGYKTRVLEWKNLPRTVIVGGLRSFIKCTFSPVRRTDPYSFPKGHYINVLS